jgi:hypothetical protein
MKQLLMQDKRENIFSSVTLNQKISIVYPYAKKADPGEGTRLIYRVD